MKTAGTSVESYYEPFCMPEGLWEESHQREEYESETGIIGYRGRHSSGCRYYNHMPASEIRNLVGPLIWDNYFKFTVVRNPFSKLISAWFHFHRPKVTIRKTVRSLVAHPLSIPLLFTGKKDIHDFRGWIRRGGSIIDRDKYQINGEVCVDFFIRQECLLDDIANVDSILGIDQSGRSLPKFKSGIRSREFAIRDFYDNKTENIVRRLYAWEFDRFGYDMPNE